MDGRGLTKPIEVEIFRNISPPGAAQPNAAAPSAAWVTITAADLATIERDGVVTYRDHLSPAEFSRFVGSTFSFRVVTLTRGARGRARRSEPSNVARTKLLIVPPPIRGLQAVQKRGELALRWSAPREGLSGASRPVVRGYRVYRSVEGEPGLPPVVAETALAEYRDVHFHFGTTYVYKVRAVVSQSGYMAETADSAPVSITPRPIFPPPPPTGLTAVFTGAAVRLIWNPSVEQGIAGYNVYRQMDGKPARRLNEQLLRTPLFTDTRLTAGATLRYWVTAVDLNQNESKPSSPATAEIR